MLSSKKAGHVLSWHFIVFLAYVIKLFSTVVPCHFGFPNCAVHFSSKFYYHVVRVCTFFNAPWLLKTQHRLKVWEWKIVFKPKPQDFLCNEAGGTKKCMANPVFSNAKNHCRKILVILRTTMQWVIFAAIPLIVLINLSLVHSKNLKNLNTTDLIVKTKKISTL